MACNFTAYPTFESKSKRNSKLRICETECYFIFFIAIVVEKREKPNTCKLCGMIMNSPEELKEHEKIHECDM